MEVRIQKYIADCGFASRRAAEEMIRSGRVTVNGEPAAIGMKIDPSADAVSVDGTVLVPRAGERTYVLLNKPAGCLSAARDDRGRKTVCDAVDIPGVRLFPAGRLDMNTEGLIILSDDGDAVNRFIHPSGNVEKVYIASVTGKVDGETVARLSSPIEIDGRLTRPAKVEVLSADGVKTTLKFTICEGRNRQIRRLCERSGLTVKKLVRKKIGIIEDDALPTGSWRYLTEEEIEYLKGI